MRNQQPGFTLLELLIALSIFAILSLLVASALHHSLFAYAKIKENSIRLSRLAIAEQLMRRDFANIQARPVTTINGKKLAAVTQSVLPSIEITTASRDNPGGLFNRSNLQRIRYELSDQQLIRTTWLTLDGYAENGGDKEVLLDQVESLHIYFVNSKGEKKLNWDMGTQFSDTHLPAGILIDIDFTNHTVFHGNFSVVFQGQGGDD